jgi:hypothetical protein
MTLDTYVFTHQFFDVLKTVMDVLGARPDPIQMCMKRSEDLPNKHILACHIQSSFNEESLDAIIEPIRAEMGIDRDMFMSLFIRSEEEGKYYYMAIGVPSTATDAELKAYFTHEVVESSLYRRFELEPDSTPLFEVATDLIVKKLFPDLKEPTRTDGWTAQGCECNFCFEANEHYAVMKDMPVKDILKNIETNLAKEVAA